MATHRILAVAPPGRAPGWADALSSELGIPHFTLTALAREEERRKTRLGRSITESLMTGDFLDVRAVRLLVEDAVKRRGVEGFVLSGLPLDGALIDELAAGIAATHAVAALGGLPERAVRTLDALRKRVKTLDVASDLPDADVLRQAMAFLR